MSGWYPLRWTREALMVTTMQWGQATASLSSQEKDYLMFGEKSRLLQGSGVQLSMESYLQVCDWISSHYEIYFYCTSHEPLTSFILTNSHHFYWCAISLPFPFPIFPPSLSSLPPPPATRVQQAQLFNDPQSSCDVMVATDAVGMGLNL